MEHLLLWLRYAVKARCMPDEAYNSAIFDETEDGRAASDVTALVELDPGCAGHDTPADSPGGGSMTSGCAGCDTPAANPCGGSMVFGCASSDTPDDCSSDEAVSTASVVTTGVGPGDFFFSTRYSLKACIARVVPKPGVVGPTVGPGVGNPEVL